MKTQCAQNKVEPFKALRAFPVLKTSHPSEEEEEVDRMPSLSWGAFLSHWRQIWMRWHQLVLHTIKRPIYQKSFFSSKVFH